MGRPDENAVKSGALKLAQLASHDDILTDALVDRVYFWTTIRKNRARYFASRGIREEDVTKILQNSVVIGKDPAKAAKELLELPGLKRYYEKLGSNDEKEHFNRHLRKYVSIYMPDCPFEVSTTNRYTIDTQEAAAVARREVKKGEEIKYLSGIQIPLTLAEEKDLGLTRRDFSIVVSSRKRTSTLFMGPARFANHDCNANARLTARGTHGMAVVAVRDIKLNEEITVSYGDDYFGIDNCECLCATCESLQRNGWSPLEEDAAEVNQTPEVDPQGESGESRSRYRTRNASRTGFQSPASTPDPAATPSRKRKHDAEELSRSSPTPAKHRRIEDLSASTPEKMKSKLSHVLRSANADRQANSPPMASRLSPPASSVSSSGNILLPQNKASSTTTLSGNFGVLNTHRGETSNFQLTVSIRDESELPNADNFRVDIIPRKSPAPDSQPVLVVDTIETNDILEPRAESQPDPDPRSGSEPERATSTSSTQHEETNRNQRYPKDYTLTPLLLSTPFSRWVRCRVCSGDFVQEDAYQTRWSCPRCERHSKLYGYVWPKTDKAGKHDNVERILDHRMVHRFVYATEEKQIKKGRFTSLVDLHSGASGANATEKSPAQHKQTNGQEPRSAGLSVDQTMFEKHAVSQLNNRRKRKRDDDGEAENERPNAARRSRERADAATSDRSNAAEHISAGQTPTTDDEDPRRRNPSRAKRRTRAYRNSETPPAQRNVTVKAEPGSQGVELLP